MPELISRRIRTCDVRPSPAASTLGVPELAPGPVAGAPDQLAIFVGQLTRRAQVIAVVVQDAAGPGLRCLVRVLKLLGLMPQPGQVLLNLPRHHLAPGPGLQGREVIRILTIRV